MQVNFKGNYLNSTYIRKFNPATKKFIPEMVHFVEINPQNKQDIKSLKRVSKFWKEQIYAKQIYKTAKTKPSTRTFALTTQNDEFGNLNSEKILSICQLSKEDAGQFCIEHLETKPEYQQENRNREYKRIGRRTLHSLKKVFYDKTLRVNYLFDKIPFYMDNGFDFQSNLYGDLIWRAPKRKSNL